MSSDDFSDATSKMVTNIILPCYLFAHIMNNIRLADYHVIFQCFIGCLVVIIVGLLIGFLSSKCIANTKKKSLFITSIMSTCDSATFLVILAQICGPILDSIQPPELGGLTADKRAIHYIAVITFINNVWKWTACYFMVQKEVNDCGKKDDSQPKMIELKEHEEDGEYMKLLERNNDSIHEVSNLNNDNIDSFTWKEFFNFPLASILLTLVFVCIPPVQSYITTKESFLNVTIVSVNVLVSKSYNFLCMFLIGLFLYEFVTGKSIKTNKANQFLGVTDIIWVTSLKLLLMPLLVLPCLILTHHYLMKVDIVLFYVLFILSASPIDMNMLVMCGFKGAFIETCCVLCSIMFVVCILTFILQSTLGIYVLGYLNNGVTA